MPLSNNFAARVPCFGEIKKINSEEFAQLCRVIYDDEFLKKNIIAIQIMPSGNLKCSTGTTIIKSILEGSRCFAKFKDYKAFSKAVVDSTLYKYKR
jgi:cell division protein FtsQ